VRLTPLELVRILIMQFLKKLGKSIKTLISKEVISNVSFDRIFEMVGEPSGRLHQFHSIVLDVRN
jgi:hypothetical protein